MKLRTVYLSCFTACLLLGGCASEGEAPFHTGDVPPSAEDETDITLQRDPEEWRQAYEARIAELEALIADYEKRNASSTEPTEPLPEAPLFSYVAEEGGIRILAYLGSERVVVIPHRIDGLPVRWIGDGAFRGSSVEEVMVPHGVETVGWFAFQGCEALRRVTLPETVSMIQYGAFEYCSRRLCFSCPADSYAAQYAKSCGIPLA